MSKSNGTLEISEIMAAAATSFSCKFCKTCTKTFRSFAKRFTLCYTLVETSCIISGNSIRRSASVQALEMPCTIYWTTHSQLVTT